jgi:HAD superfamily hydrolase (TIGR01484 family)
MKKLIAFDLDDTLAITKSPITDRMSELLEKLLVHYDVCVITGGSFEQIKKQVASRLEVEDLLLRKLHLMPTCGTRYYRYHESKHEWEQQYAEDLSPTQKKKIIETLEEAAKKLNLWEANPAGEIIEDRGSQITYSALGQQASPAEKYAWDQDGTKKHAIRDYVAERLDDLEVRVGGTTSVDVTTIGIDKAYGMKKLIEALGISKEEILFIGDKLEEGGNDYPVKAFGIDTIAVDGWQDTALVLEGILAIS